MRSCPDTDIDPKSLINKLFMSACGSMELVSVP